MKKFEKPILVTRPYLPPIEDFKQGLEAVWTNQWLTNNGPMLQQFQAELSRYLGVPETNLALFNNGTLALELGYYAMGLAGGDVITTPFTFVATSHALKRIGANPIFADIDPETMCLSPKSAWRTSGEEVYRVLWTPRWNPDEGASHFLPCWKVLLNWARENAERVEFVLRPHPLMFCHLQESISLYSMGLISGL